MRVAVPHWQGRVSPVFDVARNVLVVEIGGSGDPVRQELALDGDDPRSRAMRLVESGAEVLVCGAISRPMEQAVLAAGIEVIPQTCGEIECVLAAFLDGRLGQGEFLMPGCCGRRRRRMGCGRRGRHTV